MLNLKIKTDLLAVVYILRQTHGCKFTYSTDAGSLFKNLKHRKQPISS